MATACGEASTSYRVQLADLFQGDSNIRMFKKRDIYRHLTKAAECTAHCARTVYDITLKEV